MKLTLQVGRGWANRSDRSPLSAGESSSVPRCGNPEQVVAWKPSPRAQSGVVLSGFPGDTDAVDPDRTGNTTGLERLPRSRTHPSAFLLTVHPTGRCSVGREVSCTGWFGAGGNCLELSSVLAAVWQLHSLSPATSS